MKPIIVPITREHQYTIPIVQERQYEIVIGKGITTGKIVLHKSYHSSTKSLTPTPIGIAMSLARITLHPLRTLNPIETRFGIKLYDLSVRKEGEAEELTPSYSEIQLGMPTTSIKTTRQLALSVSEIGIATSGTALKKMRNVEIGAIGIQTHTDVVSIGTVRKLSLASGVIGLNTQGIDVEVTQAMPVKLYASSSTTSNIALGAARTLAVGASVGEYAIFAGGILESDGSYTRNIDVYSISANGTINHAYYSSSATRLSTARVYLASTSGPNYAIFAGGTTSGSSASAVVDAYNSALTRSTLSGLSQARASLAGALTFNTNQSAMSFFAGGVASGTSGSAVMDVYQEAVKASVSASLSDGRYNLAGVRDPVSGNVMFGGGMNYSIRTGYTFFTTVDAYTSSGTRTTLANGLFTGVANLAAAHTVTYTLFAGGQSSSSGKTSSITPYYAQIRTTELQLPMAVSIPSGASVSTSSGDNIYAVFAGGSGNSAYTDSVVVYNDDLVRVDGGQLKLQHAVAGAGTACVAPYLFIAGGYDYSNNVYVTDTDVFIAS